MLSEKKLLDLVERAFNAGCFREVVKMIKAKSSLVVIEKVIEKAKEKQESEMDFDWGDLFGGD
tara:strand:- start:1491 stop:1679 length:189 start_codon:yes stop_codon:yes gene_type:complete